MRRTRKERAEPQRTCAGCRKTTEQSGLVRLTRRPDGALVVGRHEPGRGVWLCQGSAECFETAVRHRALSKALRSDVSEAAIEAVRAKLS